MMYSSDEDVTPGSTEAAISNVKLPNWSRLALCAVVLLICAAVLMTQPPQNSLPLFAVVAATSLGAGLMLSRQQPSRTQPSSNPVPAPQVAMLSTADFGATSELRSIPALEPSADDAHSLELDADVVSEPPVVSELAFAPTAWPSWQQMAVVLGSLLLMFVGQFQIYRNGDQFATSSGFMLMLLGIGGIFVMLNGAFPKENADIEVPEKVQPAHISWKWLAVSVGLACIEAWRSIVKPPEAYLGEHLLLWLLSMVTFVIAVSPLKGQMSDADKKPLRRWEYGLLLALLIGAFAVRIYNIERLPYYYDNDEALFALEGAQFIPDHFLITPFEPGIHSHPRLYQAMIGLTVEIFGPTMFGARLVSVLLGTLTIPAVYLLGRELRDWQAGLVAALFMLPWSYAIQFSRLSMNQPADPLFATLAFYFLLRGLRRGTAVDYALSGIMVGIAQMFYLGGRLVPLVMLAYLLFIWLTQRAVVKQQGKLLVLVPLAALIVTLPQNFFLLYFHQPLTTRADPSILVNGQIQENINSNNLGNFISDQIKYSFLAFNSLPDRSGWYGRGSNLMGIVGGPLFLIGVIVSLFIVWKRPKWSLPLGWAFAVVLSGGTLAISPPQYERYFPGISAYSLLVEFGIAAVALVIARILGKQERSRSLAVGLGVLVCAANLIFYMGVYAPAGDFNNIEKNWIANRISKEAVAAAEAGQEVVFLGGFQTSVENTLIMQYFMFGRDYLMQEGALDDVMPKVSKTKPLTFIIAISRHDDLVALTNRYPGGQSYQVNLDEDSSAAYYVYKIPPLEQTASVPTATTPAK